MSLRSTIVATAALLLSTAVKAHEHHNDKIEEGQAISADPIDLILWTHILIQSLAWGVIFPTGMVLGVCHDLIQRASLSDNTPDNTIEMARPRADGRLPPRSRWILPRT